MRPLSRTTVPGAVAVLALVLTLAVPTGVRAQSIEEAREQQAEIQERLDQAADRLAELESRIGSLSDETEALADRVAELEATARSAEERVGERVRDMYKHGADTPVLQMFGSEDPDAALERAELAGQLLAGDRVELEEAAAARARATAASERLSERRDELQGARQELEETLDGLREDLQAAAALEERLVEEKRQREAEERRRAEEEARREAAAQRQEEQEQEAADTTSSASTGSSSAPSSGGTACPMGRPHSFTDTWGAPRSGGRSHKGVDILADYGTPVYAIVSGTWDIYSYGSSAGNWAILRGDNGHDYYYMHLQSHVVGDGARVSAGTQTGTNGDTGNATGTPHLHFEYHPGGGGAVNPYPLVRGACG